MSTPEPFLEDLWRRPMPEMASEPLTRLYIRGAADLARRKWIRSVEGLEHIAVENDPFVLVANHSQRPETVILNALLAFHRDGRLVHFLADWPMMLVPGVAMLYRRGGVIPVFGKKPKVRFLAAVEQFFRRAHPGTAWERARNHLDAGRSVGVFPEATMNRNRRRMLRGRPGAALLALEAGVPVVPVGLRFHDEPRSRPIGDFEPFSVHIGPAIPTPAIPSLSGDDQTARTLLRSTTKELQRELMLRISELCGKTWRPDAARRKGRADAAESSEMNETTRTEPGDRHGVT
ncbi:MAG: 1-acyl-sn-glycerol-3-phosphate acyltransferase [Thermoanaerobaculia bacterium]|nr:1-acyl-sn-glycerol-3-phosphate acyltransferase [Thermoanaerobaculia bacterium]